MPKIFIVGPPRCGTTLLQNIIASCDNFYSFPESNIMPILTKNIGYGRSLPPLINFGVSNKIRFKLAKSIIKQLEINQKKKFDTKLIKQILRNKSIDTRSFIVKIFQALNKDNKKKDFIEKTPNHVYFVTNILSIFPDAKLINIVRDPRDMVYSFQEMLRLQKKPSRSIYEICKIWNCSVNYALKYNLFNIRYEDLVLNPIDTINDIQNFIGIKLNYQDTKMKCYANKTILSYETWKKNNFSSLSSKFIGKYKKQLGNEEINSIEKFCFKNMERLGYKSSLSVDKDVKASYADKIKFFILRYHHIRSQLFSDIKKIFFHL